MTLFQALQTSGSGLTTYRTWLDAIAMNVANINTVRRTDEAAFQSRFVVAESIPDPDPTGPGDDGASGIGRGVRVREIEYGDPDGRIMYDPQHPLADEQGLVRYPDVDLGREMTDLLVAQRAYQANLAVVERARDAYQAALQIGR